MEKLGAQALITTLDEVQPHRISLKSRVVQETPRARMLSQYLCGTETPDSAHIIHEVQIRDRHGKMQYLWALIDCSTTSIIMAPKLLKWLGISHEAAHITTLSRDGGVMQHAKYSRKTWITIQHLDYLAPVNESDVLVVILRAYDLVLGLPLVHKRNPDINWAHRRLTALLSWGAHGVEEMTPMTMAVASKVSEAENDNFQGRGPDKQTLSATAFYDFLASDEVVEAFTLRIRECTGLLGEALEDTTLDSPSNKSQALDATSSQQRRQLRQTSHSEETLEWLLPAHRHPKGVTGRQGLDPLLANR